MLKLIGLISFILQMVCLLYNSVKERFDRKNENYYSSCATFYWFALNCSQNLILCFFVLIGVYILRAVHKYNPETELAQKMHEEHKTTYMSQLATCVVTLLIVIFIGNFYTTFLYFSERNSENPSCTRITKSWAFNQMFWFVQRTLIYSLWVYPFIWMHCKDLNASRSSEVLKMSNDTDWFAKS